MASSFALLLAGCSLAPKKFSDVKEGEWQGKVLVHDKLESKRGIVNIKVKAVDGERMRMDVTSPVGSHLASFLVTGHNLQYFLTSEKTLYRGKASRESLRSVLKVPIAPDVLYNVLFDRPVESKNWSCATDDKGFLQLCKELRTGLKIEWVNRKGDQRTIEIDHQSASLQMNLYDFESKISEPDKAFQIKVPASFKTQNL